MPRTKPWPQPQTARVNASGFAVGEGASVIIGTVQAWLPTEPPRPAPVLMDVKTTLLFFNLRREKDPEDKGRTTLNYFQYQQGLKSIRVGKRSMFRLDEVLRFIKAKESMS